MRNCITQYEIRKSKSEANDKQGGKRTSGEGRKVVCFFYWHLVCIKITITILDTHSARKTIMCGVLTNQNKKMGKHTNYYALAESG